MDKAKKIRLVYIAIILLLDILLIPQLLNFLLMARAGNASAWAETLSLFGGIAILPKVFPLWKWFQLLILAVVCWIYFYGWGIKTSSNNDIPPAAGHGQHGTSRWMKQKEIDKAFTVHKM